MSDNANVRISQEVTIRNFAEVIINGVSKGKQEINGNPSLREFAEELSVKYGVKSFNVTVDGKPVTNATQANAPVQAGSSVGLHAKDSRGSKRTSNPPAQSTEAIKEPEQPRAEMAASTDQGEGTDETAKEETASADQPEQVKEPADAAPESVTT